jgi:hypothetical protein
MGGWSCACGHCPFLLPWPAPCPTMPTCCARPLTQQSGSGLAAAEAPGAAYTPVHPNPAAMVQLQMAWRRGQRRMGTAACRLQQMQLPVSRGTPRTPWPHCRRGACLPLMLLPSHQLQRLKNALSCLIRTGQNWLHFCIGQYMVFLLSPGRDRTGSTSASDSTWRFFCRWDDIAQGRSAMCRLAAAAEEAGGAAAGVLRRAWLAGPHRVGPSLLVTRERRGGLWDVPTDRLLRLGRKAAGAPAAPGGPPHTDDDAQQVLFIDAPG